jgi:hypothetical protein
MGIFLLFFNFFFFDAENFIYNAFFYNDVFYNYNYVINLNLIFENILLNELDMNNIFGDIFQYFHFFFLINLNFITFYRYSKILFIIINLLFLCICFYFIHKTDDLSLYIPITNIKEYFKIYKQYFKNISLIFVCFLIIFSIKKNLLLLGLILEILNIILLIVFYKQNINLKKKWESFTKL